MPIDPNVIRSVQVTLVTDESHTFVYDTLTDEMKQQIAEWFTSGWIESEA